MLQLNIFDLPMEKPVQQVSLKVHDTVRFLLLEESVNSEVHYYRKYYFEYLIGKQGTILAVKGNTVLVKIGEEVILCEARELEWIA